MYTSMYACMHVCMYVCIPVCMYTYKSIYIYMYTYGGLIFTLLPLLVPTSLSLALTPAFAAQGVELFCVSVCAAAPLSLRPVLFDCLMGQLLRYALHILGSLGCGCTGHHTEPSAGKQVWGHPSHSCRQTRLTFKDAAPADP